MSLFIAAGIATLLALPIALLLALKKPVPVIISALPGLIVLGGAWLQTAMGYPMNLEEFPISRWVSLQSMAISETLAPLGMLSLLAAAPALIVLLGAAVSALRSSDKRWILALLGAGLVFSLVGGIGRDFLLHAPHQLIPLYSGGVFVLGMLASVGLVGGDEGGPEAAGAAGLAFFSYVVAAGIGARSYDHQLLYAATANVSSDMLQALWANGNSIAMVVEGRGWLSAMWASGLALLGLGVACTPGGARSAGALASFIGFPLAGFFAYASAPDAAWQQVHDSLWSAQRRYPAQEFQLPLANSTRAIPAAVTVLLGSDHLSLNGEVLGVVPATGPDSDLLSKLGAKLTEARELENLVPGDLEEIPDRIGGPKGEKLVYGADRRLIWSAHRSVLLAAEKQTFDDVYIQSLSYDAGGVRTLRVGLALTPGSSLSIDAKELSIDVKENGWRVQLGDKVLTVPCSPGKCDEDVVPLRTAMVGLKKQFPEISAVTIVPSDAVSWQQILLTFDGVGSDREGRDLFPDLTLGTRSNTALLKALLDKMGANEPGGEGPQEVFGDGDPKALDPKVLEALGAPPVDPSGAPEGLVKASVSMGNLKSDDPKIRSTVRRKLGQMKYCYETRLKVNPEVEGRVTLEFIVNPEGNVGSSKLVESTAKDDELPKCMLNKLKRWRFETRDQPTTVVVPFIFQPVK